MGTSAWDFASEQRWQDFARSFRSVMGARRPKFAERLAGMSIEFVPAAEISGGAFESLDQADGLVFDVVAVISSSQAAPTSVRLTLHETTTGGTRGGIFFQHPVGSAGKDLGELARQSVQAVDHSVRF